MTTYDLEVIYTDNQVHIITIEFAAHLVDAMLKSLVENDSEVVSVTIL